MFKNYEIRSQMHPLSLHFEREKKPALFMACLLKQLVENGRSTWVKKYLVGRESTVVFGGESHGRLCLQNTSSVP